MLYPQSAVRLFELYHELIKEKGITAKQLHQWREEGAVIENIKAIYEAMPLESRGEPYAWFLAHQSVLEQPTVTPDDINAVTDRRNLTLWALLGLKESMPEVPEDMVSSVVVESFDKPMRTCWDLYSVLYEPCLPNPTSPHWIIFGFCACPTVEELRELADAYRRMLFYCSFIKLRDAVANNLLHVLFKKYIITIPSQYPFFEDCLFDALSGSPWKGVWVLKQSFAENIDALNWKTGNEHVDFEYRITRCKNANEKRQLFNLYKNFFANPASNPLKLHAAAKAFRLFQFFEEDMGIQFGRNQRIMLKRILEISPRIRTSFP